MFFLILLPFWLFIQSTFGATIAIIDTGFDLDHQLLKTKILKQNSKTLHPDFNDNSHLKEAVIKDPQMLSEIFRYRTMRAKGHREGLAMEEFEWFKQKTADKRFMEQVRSFKKHSHGTFVAGIALRDGENIHLFPIRGLNLPTTALAFEEIQSPSKTPKSGLSPEEKFRFEVQQSQERVVRKFARICEYLSGQKIDVVNASYGINFKSIGQRFKDKYFELTGNQLPEEQLQSITLDYFDFILKGAKDIVSKFPHMLFIFSAGNSGLDNDQFPHYPSRLRLDNTLTVAAMNGDYLASFSNYGKSHVDIGAPGVGIPSIVPGVYSPDGKEVYSPSSGTSMAAPYVANLAAQMLNINPKLSAADLKKIILSTGDEKEYLKEKLLSSSMVNNHQAIKASLLSRDLPLANAISLAKSGLIPMEDSISIGQPPAVPAQELKEKIFDAIPKAIAEPDLDVNPEEKKN